MELLDHPVTYAFVGIAYLIAGIIVLAKLDKNESRGDRFIEDDTTGATWLLVWPLAPALVYVRNKYRKRTILNHEHLHDSDRNL